MFIFILLTGKCLDRSDLLHKVFISDCDPSKTTQKWEMNNIVAVWRRLGDDMRTYTLTHTCQEIHPYYKFTDISNRYCPFAANVFDMSQLVSVHFQHAGVRLVQYKDTEYRLLTASTPNWWHQPNYAFLWSLRSWIIDTSKLQEADVDAQNQLLDKHWNMEHAGLFLSSIVFTHCLYLFCWALRSFLNQYIDFWN